MKKLFVLVFLLLFSLTACSDIEKTEESDLKVLATPVVSISSSGLASWDDVKHAEGYAYKINNGKTMETDETEVQLELGDSIKVKALGDGEKYDDSKYSKVVTYGENETVIEPTDTRPEPTEPIYPTPTIMDESKTIVFYNTMGTRMQEVLQVVIEEFESKYPGWEVESVQVGGYEEVYNTIMNELEYGKGPDIAYCYGHHVADYLPSGRVLDLNEFIYSLDGYNEDELADFVPGIISEGYAANFSEYESYGYNKDSLLMMPFQKSTEVLYYNQTALNELGVSVPESWEDLWKICKLAKERWPNSVPFGYDNESNWLFNMAMQNYWELFTTDEPYYLFNNVNTINWLDELSKYYNEGLFTTMELYGSYASNLFTKGAEDGCIFTIGSSAGASYHSTSKFEWGVAPIPGSNGNHATIAQGPSLVMFESYAENSYEKEMMTFEFMQMLLLPEVQLRFSEATGYISPRLSTRMVPEYNDLLKDTSNISIAATNVAYDNVYNLYTLPILKDSADLINILGNALVYSVSGMKTSSQALSDAYQELTGEYVDSTLFDAAKEFMNYFDFTDNKSDEYISLPSAYTYDGKDILIHSWHCDSWLVNIDWNKMYLEEVSEDTLVKIYATMEYNGQVTSVSFNYIIKSKDSPELRYQIVTNPVVGESYLFGCNQETLEQILFFTGETANRDYYMATTGDANASVEVTLEDANGGYYLSFIDPIGNKKYLDVVVTGSYINGRIVDYPTAVWYFDYEYNTFISTVDVNGETMIVYYGTYNTYNTLSTSKYVYISTSFPCHLYVDKYGEEIPTPTPDAPTPDVPTPTPEAEPAPLYTTIENLVINAPEISKDVIYIVEGTWKTKDGTTPSNNIYGNGTLNDSNGNSIIVYGLCSSKESCLTFADGLYQFKNAKDFMSLNIEDGSIIKIGMVYNANYKNYSGYLIDIIGKEEIEEEIIPVSPNLTKVESVEQLVDGTKIVLAHKTFLMGAYDWTKLIFNSVELAQVELTSDVQVITLIKYDNNWLLQVNPGEFLCYDLTTVGNKIHIISDINETCLWNIEIIDGLAIISNVATPERTIQYNVTSPRFVCYKSIQSNPALYIVNDTDIPNPTPTPEETYDEVSVSDFINMADTSNYYRLHGYVTAVNKLDVSGSFVITDLYGTSIFSYSGANVTLGDEIIIEGIYQSYNGFPQLSSVNVIEVVSSNNDLSKVSGYLKEVTTYEISNDINNSKEELISAYNGLWLKITGVVVKEGSYYGLANQIDGSKVVNIYYNKGIDFSNYVGCTVELYCFVRGVNEGNFITVQVQNVVQK